MRDRLDAFQDRIGYRFARPDYLALALTHASLGEDRNYERLEFLGDRVLGLVMAELLYKTFPDEAEGNLARRHAALVSGAVVAQCAEKINLADAINLSGAERAAGGARNENTLADAMEALIGAIYLDSGVDPCRILIERLWGDMLHTMDKPPIEPKTELQEWAQARGLPLPIYDIVGRDGPDHAPVFTVEVRVDGFPPVRASGPSRRVAEKTAAQTLLDLILRA
jgi:ribonuclease-3